MGAGSARDPSPSNAASVDDIFLVIPSPPPQRIASQRPHHFERKPSITFATKSALSGHARRVGRCPLSGVKRTLIGRSHLPQIYEHTPYGRIRRQLSRRFTLRQSPALPADNPPLRGGGRKATCWADTHAERHSGRRLLDIC